MDSRSLVARSTRELQKLKDYIDYCRWADYQDKLRSKFPYRKGTMIHLHSIRGTYTVTEFDMNTITVTCKKWDYTKTVPAADFKAIFVPFSNTK